MASSIATNTSGSGADAVVTLAASTQGKRYVIETILCSYNGGSATTALTVVSGSTTLLTADLAVGTTVRTTNMTFGPNGFGCGVNEAVVITLGLVASQVAHLNVVYRVE